MNKVIKEWAEGMANLNLYSNTFKIIGLKQNSLAFPGFPWLPWGIYWFPEFFRSYRSVWTLVKSSALANSLSTFLIFAGWWSARHKLLTKYDLNHSLSIMFWTLIRPFLDGLILSLVWYSCYRLRLCITIVIYRLRAWLNIVIYNCYSSCYFCSFIVFAYSKKKKTGFFLSLWEGLVEFMADPPTCEIFFNLLFSLR